MTQKGESKILTAVVQYFAATGESMLPAVGFGMLLGGVAGAIEGWKFFPPETLNIIQLLCSIVGLLLGAIFGGIALFLLMHSFLLLLVVGAVVLLVQWMFSS